jgi:hypothetical protein
MKKALPALVALLIFVPTLSARSSETRGYTVQVASMPDEENARAEVNRLVRHQEAAYYVKAVVQGKGLYYRVRVGRFTTQEVARAHAEALKRNKLINDFLITTFEGLSNIAMTGVPSQASKQNAEITRSYQSDAQAPKASNRPAVPGAAVVTVANARAANVVKNEEYRPPASLSSNRPSAGSNVAPSTLLVQKRSERRIKLYVHATTSISFDNSISSLTVLDPAIVAAEVTGGRTATLTGLAQGESVIIASSGDHRRTFVIEVMARPRKTAEEMVAEAAHRQRKDRVSGSVTLHFSPATGDGPSLFRQRFEYAQKMGGGRTLFLNGDVFNYFGRAGGGGLLPLLPRFGTERVSLGVSAPTGTLNILDSQLDISPLSFYGYTLRGLHLASDKGSLLEGLEIFGGIARPSPLSFIGSEGYVVGAIAPIARGSSWRLRAGVSVIAPRRQVAGEGGGGVWQADARYAPDEHTKVEGEAAYDNNEISWRARLDIRRGPVSISGEALRLDAGTPFVGIGAQPGGRQMSLFSLQWLPGRRFAGAVNYNHTRVSPVAGVERVALNSSSLLANASYNVNDDSHISLRFAEQKIEAAASAISAPLRLETKAAALAYNARFTRQWSNAFEARMTSSREARAGAGTERGLTLREELSCSGNRRYATGYFNYTFNTPSLAGLVIRDPSLLPPLIRQVYEADPAGFLIANRGLLSSLLANVELPETRSVDLGVRFLEVFSRYTLTGDVRYSGGEFFARPRHDLFTTLGIGVRVDAANSIQLMAARSFTMLPGGGTLAVTASYTHRFGAEGGGGFQFAHLLGLDRSKIRGRVFADVNGNGQGDTDEPGVGGVKIQLDGGATSTTDERGRFHFSPRGPGEHMVALITGDLGIRLRASTATEQAIYLTGKRDVNLEFGVTDFGFIGGRIFNDLSLSGKPTTGKEPGVDGVRFHLRKEGSEAADRAMTETVDSSGAFEFRDLRPGTYLLELEVATLPPDFQPPEKTAWSINVEPLKGSYQDMPVAAQRAVSGIVFVDKDGDGKFDPGSDAPIMGARVRAWRSEAITGNNGAYILRNLPSGPVEVTVSMRGESKGPSVEINLAAEPTFLRNVNLVLPPKL